jgi:hypothetical protein
MNRKGKSTSRNLVKNDNSYRRSKKGRKNKRGRAQVYGAAIRQVKQDVSTLWSMLNVEDKYLDTSATVTLSATWGSNLLNGLSQGNTSSTRQGQSVKVVGFEFRYTLYLAAAGTSSTSRILIFRDKQANGAAPNVTQVYPVDVTTPRVVADIDRFIVNVEDTITLTTTGNNAWSESHVFRDSWHIDFNSGNTGVITDIVTNSLYISYVNDGTVNFPSLSYTCRVIYVDN